MALSNPYLAELADHFGIAALFARTGDSHGSGSSVNLSESDRS